MIRFNKQKIQERYELLRDFIESTEQIKKQEENAKLLQKAAKAS